MALTLTIASWLLATGGIAAQSTEDATGPRESEGSPVPAAPPSVRDAEAGAETERGLSLLDGTIVPGTVAGLDGAGVHLEGRDEPIALWEIREIRLQALAGAPPEPRLPQKPIVVFRSGERVVARVVEVPVEGPRAGLARLRLVDTELPEIDVPLATIAAFRLREAHPQDDIFETDLDAEPAETDTVYLRRQGLFRFRRVFRGLDDERVWVEDSGRRRAIRRTMIQGVLLAPVASTGAPTDPPAILEMPGVGRFPAHVLAITPTESGELELRVRAPGAPEDAARTLPATAVRRILPASDRVLFLSDSTPAAVEETAVVGQGLAHRQDLSVAGTPLRLGGRTYRRGLGVHSRTVLEYRLGGRYSTFAAVIGLDASSRGRGSVTFIVTGDGQELLRHVAVGDTPARPISLPIAGIDALRLEVDHGPDGLDFADHADWADARVTR